MKLNHAHHPWSIEFQTKEVNPRSNELSDEEIVSVESDAIDNIEYQSLHSAFKFSFKRVSFDGPESTPQDMVYYAWQVLQVFDKELLWYLASWGNGFIMLSIWLISGSGFLKMLCSSF